MTYITWNDARSLPCYNIQWIIECLCKSNISHPSFSRRHLFLSHSMVLEGTQSPKLFASTGTSQGLRGDTRGQRSLIQLLDQCSTSSNTEGSVLKSTHLFLCLHKISSLFLHFPFHWLHKKLWIPPNPCIPAMLPFPIASKDPAPKRDRAPCKTSLWGIL